MIKAYLYSEHKHVFSVAIRVDFYKKMFTDETLDLVGADSTWRKSHKETQESVS